MGEEKLWDPIYTAFERGDYAVAVKLLGAIPESKAMDKLNEEAAKAKPEPDAVKGLQQDRQDEEQQLKNRQKPFSEWLQVFDTAVFGKGEYGTLGGWAKALELLDQEQEARHKKRMEFVSAVEDEIKSKRDHIAGKKKDESPSTQAKLEKSVEQMIALLEAPISLEGAYNQRIWACVMCFTLALFIVLAHSIFGSGEVTLVAFLAVQASISALFFQTMPIEEFERKTMESAFAYCVSRFRTNYNYDFHRNERTKPDSPCFSCFNKCMDCINGELDDVLSGYFKWRAMALYKMKLIHEQKKNA